MVLQDWLVSFALLPLPPKTWVVRVFHLHPAYIQVAFSHEDTYDSPFGVTDHCSFGVKGNSVLSVVADLAHGQ